MEKLSICRICLSNDIGLRSIVNTHLHEMYEFLTKMPFVTEDSTPILACGFCCAKLEYSYELRRRCLQSEELFTQLLRSNVQVNLQIMPAILLRVLSVEDVLPMTPNAFDSEVKQEAPEDARNDSSTSADSEDDTGTCSMIKTEPKVDYVVRINEAAAEQDGAELTRNALSLHSELDIPLDIVKEESDVLDTEARDDSSSGDETDTRDIVRTEVDDVMAGITAPKRPQPDAQTNREDKPSKNFKRSDHSKDKIVEPKSETKKAVEDKPVKKNKRVETCDKLDIELHSTKQNSTFDHNDVHREISANNIRAHRRFNNNSSNELKQFACDTCQKCFRWKSALITHIRTHTGEKPYQCNECKKCFCSKQVLHIHTRTHKGEKPYQCNVCKKCFIQKSSLNKHIRTHTGGKPYQCNECKKCYRSKQGLDIHTRTHTGEKPHQCNVCKKCFTQKSSLNNHIRTHRGEKPYQCNECKKCFRRKQGLDIHTRTHTGEKPYQCNVCKKCFIQKSSLNKHIRTHTGGKPYQCNECKLCYSSKQGFDIHTRTHTGEKPHQCNVCKKCFTQKSSLNNHIAPTEVRSHISVTNVRNVSVGSKV